MTIQIDRFEPKPVSTDVKITMKTPKSVAIKDHATDELVVLVSFFKTNEKNLDLANKIIGLIEEEVNAGD